MTTTSPSRAHREHGFFLVWMALMIVTLMITAAFAIEWHNLSRIGIRMQKAADAAALAGAIYLPDSFDPENNQVPNEDDAVGRALEVAALNGFVNGANGTTVAVSVGEFETQLVVEIERLNVQNIFGDLLPERPMARRSVAEYNQPLAMGSPRNQYGNNPEVAGTIGDPNGPYPNFWGSIGGGRAHGKNAGEPYMSQNCFFGPWSFGPVDGCSGGGTNHDYNPDGYFYAIEVPEGATNPLKVEIYDPANITTGCASNSQGLTSPPATAAAAEADPLVPNGGSNLAAAAALSAAAIPGYPSGPAPNVRYKPGNQPTTLYCTGDNYYAPGDGTYALPWATWRVIAPDDTPNNPADYEESDVVCSAEFSGFRDNAALTLQKSIPQPYAKANGASVDFVKYFRTWFPLCGSSGVGSPEAGTYFIQVTSVEKLDHSLATFAAGHNRFSLRAGTGAATTDNVRLHGFGAMETAMVAPAGSSSFYLTRIEPNARNRELVLSFWDVGDSGIATNGTITILPPADRTDLPPGNGFQGCTYQDPIAQYTWFEFPATARPYIDTDNQCAMHGVQNDPWDAKWIRVVVPIPSTYDCDEASPTGCWLKLKFTQANGIGDTAVWKAELRGAPARIVE